MRRQGLGAARLVCVGIALLTAGCQAPACPLPGQNRADSLKLYFGRDIPGGGFVTDQAWSSFAASVLTPAFPDGFTAYEALGQWRNPRDGTIVREKSFVVEVVGADPLAKAGYVSDAYKNRFRQTSVGTTFEKLCARF